MITIDIIDGPTLTVDDEGWQHYAYVVRLSFEGRTFESPYSMGTALVDPPTAATVLETMLSDAHGVEGADGFEDWAESFGFDPDSRKAETIYKESLTQTARLVEFLGEHYDDVRELESEDAARSLTAI